MNDWLCDWFSVACADHGEYVTHAVPEVNLAALVSALVLLLGGCLIAADRWRTK